MSRTPFEIASRRGTTIRGDFYLPEGVRGRLPTVVVVHGFKGFKDWGFFPHLCEAIAEAGLLAVVYNNSGSGIGADLTTFSDPSGFQENTISGEIDDLESVLDAVAEGAVAAGRADIQRLGVVGHSRGGAVAILHSARSSAAAALITWSAVARLDRFSIAQKEKWRADGFLEVPNVRTGEVLRLGVGFLDDLEQNADALDVVEAEAKLGVPHLLLHGERDESVPVDDAHLLAQAASQNPQFEMRVLPEAGHTFGARHPLGEPSEALVEATTRTTLFLCRWLQ